MDTRLSTDLWPVPDPSISASESREMHAIVKWLLYEVRSIVNVFVTHVLLDLVSGVQCCFNFHYRQKTLFQNIFCVMQEKVSHTGLELNVVE